MDTVLFGAGADRSAQRLGRNSQPAPPSDAAQRPTPVAEVSARWLSFSRVQSVMDIERKSGPPHGMILDNRVRYIERYSMIKLIISNGIR